MTRTQTILNALRRAIEARQVELDAAEDLRYLTLELRFTPGELSPYEVIDRVERGRKRTISQSVK